MDFTAEDFGNALLCLAGLAVAVLLIAAFVSGRLHERKSGMDRKSHRRRQHSKPPESPDPASKW